MGAGGKDRDELRLEVRHLSAGLSTLTQEVGTIEARLVTLDRRLVEFCGLVQGLQEEQYAQQRAFERNQEAIASGAGRALTAEAVREHLNQEHEWQKCLDGTNDGGLQLLEQRWEAKLEEHTRWLLELQSDIAAIHLEACSPAKNGTKASAKGGATTACGADDALDTPLAARLSALEQAQRTIAVSTRRALHTALVVHKNQQDQSHLEVADSPQTVKVAQLTDDVGLKPIADLEQENRTRFALHDERLEKADRRLCEQDERLDKILQMVDTLADRVIFQGLPEEGSSAEGRADTEQLAREMRADLVGEVREKLEDMEASMYSLGAQVQALQHQQPIGQYGLSDGAYDDRREVIGYLEQRVDRGFNEMSQRLDSLQEWRDQQRITLRQIGNELPEVSQKLDQLWSQCQYYFPRVKEHDVHFSFFRTSFENHKQHMLDVTGGLSRNARLQGNSQPRGLADSVRAPQAIGLSSLESSTGDDNTNGIGTTACDPIADRLADRLASVPPPGAAFGWAAPFQRSASGPSLRLDVPPSALCSPPPAAASFSSPSFEAHGGTATTTHGGTVVSNSLGASSWEPTAGCPGSSSEARTPLQRQVMARLYADSDAPVE